MQSDAQSSVYPLAQVLPISANNTASAPRSSSSTLYSTTTSTPLGVRPPTSSQVGNTVYDTFDYEHKYAPDTQYEELFPKARVWRVYGDESSKIDIEMVAGWREGLDMLLVFAALFSAVVTAFLTATCKSMQVDNTEVTNSLLLEMIGVQRAILHVVVYGPTDVEAVPPAIISFRPKPADFWVNGLWFMSLGLSLSTTLLAVLAKQWIHQYIYVPSVGSPRNRCRVRHFRYKALAKWRVPLIIELLPVLMHAALGLFFVGLVVYLCPLSTVMAVNMAIIGAGAFGIYSITNVLPVFYPDCAYKTPLSMHFFSLLVSARQRITILFFPNLVQACSPPNSIHDIELEAVEADADVVDASALGWLFNTTANLSVQSVILQALSSLPLQSIPLISAGPDRIASVVKAINDHFYPDQPIDRYERLQRAALRLEQQEDGVRVLKSLKVPSNYTKFSHPDSAIELITANLLYPASPDTLFDAVLWGKIFQVALLPGIDWLEIDHEKPSRLWSELLRGTVSHHDCDTCDCDGNQSALFTFPLQKPMPPLSIAVYEMAKSETSLHLVSVLNKNMRPSFLKWLLHVGYSNVRRSAENHTISLPDDLFLFLNMLQTPSIQKTSSLHKLWIADNATLIRHRPKSLFRLLLDTISDYTIGSDIRVRHRQACCQATIIAMKNVLKSPSFGASTIMTPEDEASIVGSVFKGLNWSLRRFGDKDHDFSWLTPELTQRVLHVAFKDSTWSSLFVGNIFSYLLSSSELLPHVPLVYSGLLEQRWLQGLSASLDSDTTNDLSDSRPPLHLWVVLATAALAGLYVDGLAVLESHSLPVYPAVMEDLCISRNLLTLCKVLLISDVETQSRLQKLVKIAKVGRDCWEQCAIELVSFSVSEQAEYMHSMLLAFPAIGIAGKRTRNLSLTALRTIATGFQTALASSSFTPQSFSPADLVDSREQVIQWWINDGEVDNDIY